MIAQWFWRAFFYTYKIFPFSSSTLKKNFFTNFFTVFWRHSLTFLTFLKFFFTIFFHFIVLYDCGKFHHQKIYDEREPPPFQQNYLKTIIMIIIMIFEPWIQGRQHQTTFYPQRIGGSCQHYYWCNLNVLTVSCLEASSGWHCPATPNDILKSPTLLMES